MNFSFFLFAMSGFLISSIGSAQTTIEQSGIQTEFLGRAVGIKYKIAIDLQKCADNLQTDGVCKVSLKLPKNSENWSVSTGTHRGPFTFTSQSGRRFAVSLDGEADYYVLIFQPVLKNGALDRSGGTNILDVSNAIKDTASAIGTTYEVTGIRFVK